MRRFAFRRTAVVGAIWVGLLGVVAALSPSASGQETVEPGKGNAYALGVKLDPRAGQLSLGVAYGETLAGHQNNQALAEARSLNLGVIGSTLGGEACDGGDPTWPEEDQPQPLVARTDDEDEDQRSDSDHGVEREVSVAGDPLAFARATAAGGGEEGVINIGATVTETTSGVVDGRRVARAVARVASIDIGGVLTLTGLRWVAEFQTAPDEATITNFNVEGISVADSSTPLGLTEKELGSLEEANALLEQVGIRLSVPQGRVAQGIAFVSPLRISIVPNEARDSVTGGLLDALQPLREQLVQAALEQDCSFGSLITVGDIVLGSVTGAGSLHIELGGVTATSADIDIFDLNLDFGSLNPPAPAAPAAPAPASPAPAPSLNSPSSAVPPSTVATPTTSDLGSGESEQVAAPVAETRPLSGVRGGPLMYTGLAGLLLLGLLAEGDRRKMRKAQRSTPMSPGA